MKHTLILLTIILIYLESASAQVDWQAADPCIKPEERTYAAMVYDESRGEVVLFGGFGSEPLNDTWVWKNDSWELRSPANVPSARFKHELIYDSSRGEVVLFGGSGKGEFLNDTWVWNGNDWTQKAPLTVPPARDSFGFAFDRARGEGVLFGGFAGSAGRALNDTWRWNGSNWFESVTSVTPEGRNGHMMAFDQSIQNVVMFGGYSTERRNDTWLWNGSQWSDVSAAIRPPVRNYGRLVYNSLTGSLILFGGLESGTSYLGDTWEYRGGAWAEKYSSNNPFARCCHGMAITPADGVLLFGGSGGIGDNIRSNSLSMHTTRSTLPGCLEGTPVTIDAVVVPTPEVSATSAMPQVPAEGGLIIDADGNTPTPTQQPTFTETPLPTVTPTLEVSPTASPTPTVFDSSTSEPSPTQEDSQNDLSRQGSDENTTDLHDSSGGRAPAGPGNGENVPGVGTNGGWNPNVSGNPIAPPPPDAFIAPQAVITPSFSEPGLPLLRGVVVTGDSVLPGVYVNAGVLGSAVTDQRGEFQFGPYNQPQTFSVSLSRTGYILAPQSFSGVVSEESTYILYAISDGVDRAECRQFDEASRKAEVDNQLLALENISAGLSVHGFRSQRRSSRFQKRLSASVLNMKELNFSFPELFLSCKRVPQCRRVSLRRERKKLLSKGKRGVRDLRRLVKLTAIERHARKEVMAPLKSTTKQLRKASRGYRASTFMCR